MNYPGLPVKIFSRKYRALSPFFVGYFKGVGYAWAGTPEQIDRAGGRRSGL